MKALRVLIVIFLPHVAVWMQKRMLKRMKHHIDTSNGLWCIDQDPKTMPRTWIDRNAFQLRFK